jgi:hypothetical protein
MPDRAWTCRRPVSSGLTPANDSRVATQGDAGGEAAARGCTRRVWFPRLLRNGRVIEYWAHALCLLPAEDWPLFAWVRERLRDSDPWHGDVKGRYRGVAERVLEEIRERGALGSRDFGGKADPLPHRVGTRWSWKPAKQMLDALFAAGELVIAGRDSGFQRLYDLPVRVLPREVLNAPQPSQQESIRELILRAVRARGALTEYAIAEHWRPIWWLRRSAASVRPYVDSLVAIGRWSGAVEDGGAPVVYEAGVELEPAAHHRCPPLAVRPAGSEPAFRRNTAAGVTSIGAAHNPEVAGSNPAPPATGKAPETGPFYLGSRPVTPRPVTSAVDGDQQVLAVNPRGSVGGEIEASD